MEFGADIIKTNYCGDIESFRQVVAATTLPVIVAGGPSESGADNTFDVARDAVAAGAAGVAFGRRVWQASDPESVVRGLRDVVFSTKAHELSYA
jgi:fructose-bisphosphate aldolase/2-amino-3,7-dideoxy-D-threo-hept-6-ulosonate synthase